MPATIQRVVCLLGLSVSAFQGPPSLPAFGLLHSQRPQRSRNPVDMTIVTPPPQVLNAARAAGQLSRHQSAPTRPTRHSIRRRPMVRGEDESMQVAATPTRGSDARLAAAALVVPARHRYPTSHPTRIAGAMAPPGRERPLLREDCGRDGSSLVGPRHRRAAPQTTGLQPLRAASLDHCIQLSRLFLGLARRQKEARTCLAKPGWWQVAPHGKCYADGGECFLY